MLLLTGLLLAGCSALQPGYDEGVESQIATNAVEYNKALEKAANSTILLNILRSRDRRPRYFSAISQITDGVSVEVENEVELTIPFGGGAAAAFPLVPTVTVTNERSPTMNIAPQQGEEFTRAIMTPLEPQLLEFLWEQEWPRDLLLHMAATSIRDETTGEIYRNRPRPLPGRGCADPASARTDWCRFQVLVDRIAAAPSEQAKMDWVERDKCIETDLRTGKLTENEIKGFNADGLGLVERQGRYLACPLDAGETTLTFAGRDYAVKTRSPSTMIFYLGQLARLLDEAGRAPLNVRHPPACPGSAPVPLLVIARNPDTLDGYLANVDYNGETYAAGDRGCASRTNTAFSLIAQLISLKQKEDDLPGTQTVRVVN